MIIRCLLPDAEVFEDVAEDFVGGDFAGDFSEVMHGFAYVLGEEVAGVVVGQALTGALYGLTGTDEGFVMTHVGDDGVVGSRGLRGMGYEGFLQGVDVAVVLGRKGEYLLGCYVEVGQDFLFLGYLCRGEQVGLVDEGEEFFLFALWYDALSELLYMGIALGAVDEPEYNVGLGELGERAFDTHALDGVVGLAYAGGVDEAIGDALQVDDVFDGIAGSAVYVGDEGALFAQEGVEEGRFAGVGLADDDGGYSVLDGVTAAERVGQAGDDGFDVTGQLVELSAIGKLYFFFAEIQFEFNKGDELQQVCPQVGQLTAETAAHLVHGYAMSGGRTGGDEIGYGFGLREVETAVGKGTSGKFAGGGSATATVYEGLYDVLGDVGRAVAGYLDRVLSGIGVRGTEERDNDLVEQVTFVAVYFAIGQGVGATLREGGTLPVGAEKGVDDVDGFGAADTNDGNAPYPGRCGYGTYCILGQAGREGIRNSSIGCHIVIQHIVLYRRGVGERNRCGPGSRHCRWSRHRYRGADAGVRGSFRR